MTLTLEKPVYFDLSNISYRKPYLKIFGTINVQFQHLRRVLRLLDFQTVGFSWANRKKKRELSKSWAIRPRFGFLEHSNKYTGRVSSLTCVTYTFVLKHGVKKRSKEVACWVAKTWRNPWHHLTSLVILQLETLKPPDLSDLSSWGSFLHVALLLKENTLKMSAVHRIPLQREGGREGWEEGRGGNHSSCGPAQSPFHKFFLNFRLSLHLPSCSYLSMLILSVIEFPCPTKNEMNLRKEHKEVLKTAYTVSVLKKNKSAV